MNVLDLEWRAGQCLKTHMWPKQKARPSAPPSEGERDTRRETQSQQMVTAKWGGEPASPWSTPGVGLGGQKPLLFWPPLSFWRKLCTSCNC